MYAIDKSVLCNNGNPFSGHLCAQKFRAKDISAEVIINTNLFFLYI